MVLAHFVWHLLTLRSGGQVEIVSDHPLLLVQELLLGCDEHLSAALVLHLEAEIVQVRRRQVVVRSGLYYTQSTQSP